MKIGLRLGLGFGLILLATLAMLIAALTNSNISRNALLTTLQQGADRHDLAISMRAAMLRGAVAMRNMGLQSQLDALFKNAVELASQFKTEQVAKLIIDKIDPLLNMGMADLKSFINLQKQRGAAATAQDNARNTTTIGVISAAAALVLALAAALAWRITLNITVPLQTALQATARVAHGDLVSEIECSGSDGAAQLLTGLQEMRTRLARMVSEIQAITQQDQVPQQNAALVEEAAAAAESLNQQAARMVEVVSVFKLQG